MDIQPAWLYLDTRTLAAQFGYDRLRWFQPLKSLFAAGVIAGGGSDHMQKIGSLRSINPVQSLPGMAVAVTRRAKGTKAASSRGGADPRGSHPFLHAQQCLSPFSRRPIGSLEPASRRLHVLDRDLLTCPEDQIKSTRALATYLNGKRVFHRPD